MEVDFYVINLTQGNIGVRRNLYWFASRTQKKSCKL